MEPRVNRYLAGLTADHRAGVIDLSADLAATGQIVFVANHRIGEVLTDLQKRGLVAVGGVVRLGADGRGPCHMMHAASSYPSMPDDILVITPLHEAGNNFIDQAFASLLAQEDPHWQWRILENANGRVPDEIAKHPRVQVLQSEATGIGALKRQLALSEPSLPITVELDCDDTLTPDALAKIRAAYVPGAFIYSDCVEYRDDAAYTGKQARWPGFPFGEKYGWTHREVEAMGGRYIAMHAAPVTAHNIRLIYWCPNHVRAWCSTMYRMVGGHDASLLVADDHDLIVRFFLSGARFVHIPEPLYHYRVHAQNTVATQNAAIQNATWQVYNRHIWALAEHYALEQKLLRVDLCGAIDPKPGYLVLDLAQPDAAHGITTGMISCDLNERWPLADNTVGVLRAHDAIEHLRDPIHTMNEAHRVLAPGGFLMISVPSSSGKGAFCDPTHVSYWNDLSFRYYTDQHFARYISRFKGRFQLLRCIEWYPSDWHRTVNMPYVEAHLVKLGEGYEPMGEVLWPTRQG